MRDYDLLLLSEAKYLEQKNFWLERLSDVAATGLLADFNNRKQVDRRTLEISIPEELWSELARVSKRMDLSIYLILLASLKSLLYGYTGNQDISVVSPVYRELSTEETLNQYVVIRDQISAESTFKQFLLQLRETALAVYDHQDYPFDKVLEYLSGVKDDENLFDVTCLLKNIHDEDVVDQLKSNLILTFEVINESLQGHLIYNQAMFSEFTVNQFLRHYLHVLQQVMSNPELKLADIQILSDAEKEQILVEFNQTAVNWPMEKTLHQLFEEQVEQTPDNIAVVMGEESLTYRELNERANRLARVLRDKGVKPDSLVAILTKRSLEMIVGILGILKAGGAYVPIDPDYPEDRIQYMLTDSDTAILLTDDVNRALISDTSLKVIDLTDENLYVGDSANLENQNTPSDIAYIIYTSGTTGKPKGVMIEHRNVVRLMFNDQFQFDFTSNDIWTMFHSMCFDFSVWEMYGALLYGGKLVIVPKIVAQDASEFVKLLVKERVTVLNQTPSAFYNLIRTELESPEKQLQVRYVIFGGEALQPTMLKDWSVRYPQTRLINMYGITEITVHATFKELTENEFITNVSNIGKPIPTLTTYIMDQELNLLPIGVAGELCVGGDGVARGYLHKPELTASKFVINPHKSAERIYRSGDLGRWLPNGEIEYLGRIDNQVKIRGYRIELGEIEAQLLQNDLVKETVVVARENANGDKSLCAYIVSDGELTLEDLRAHLAKVLPDYMIPAFFVRLEKMPLTANGKIDRKALPEPDGSIATGVAYVPPRNDIEVGLAEVWADVLGMERVGIDDNFFSLGGDSIKAIQVASRLKKYGFKMEMKDLFQHHCIRELSRYIKQVKKSGDQGIVEGEALLTPIQSWFIAQNFTDTHHYNQAVMLYRKDGFDQTILVKAFTKILEHHDALRMVYKSEGDRLIQYNRNADESLFDLQVFDLTAQPDYKDKIEELANEIQSGIDLTNGPLVKIGLFKTLEGDHLLLAIHHLVIDGVSWRILFEDIATAYKQVEAGHEIQLPIKTHSYQQWAQMLKQFAVTKRLGQEAAYWNQINLSEVKLLPKDQLVQIRKAKDNVQVAMTLEPEYTEKLLKQVNKAYNTEINDILLTALGLAIKDWTGDDKVLLSLEGHGREELFEDVDITRTVGWFTTRYPVILDMSNSHDLSYQIKILKENLRQIPKKGIGYGILRYLAPEESKLVTPAQEPEISFNYLGQFDQDVDTGVFNFSNASAGLTQSPLSERNYVLDVNGMVANGQLVLNFSYNQHEYCQETIQQLVDSYAQYLHQVIDHCVYLKTTEITPSDLGDTELSLEELEDVAELLASTKEDFQKIYPLSPMQQGLLFLHLKDRKSSAYYEQSELRICGQLDIELFEQSINLLVQKYDILRTNFVYEKIHHPRQVVFKAKHQVVQYEDISTLPENEQQSYIETFKQNAKDQGFDLTKDNLLKVAILRTSEDSYAIIWNHHHILMDGWCVGIVLKDFFEIYRSLKKGIKLDLEATPPYSDYISWLANQDQDEAKGYWQKYLEGYQQQALPLGYQKNSEEGYVRRDTSIKLDQDLLAGLNKIAKEQHVTLNTLFQVIWGVLLQRYNNTDDVVFGTIASGRPPQVEGIEEMIGLFINAIPVRIQAQSGLSFMEYLMQVQEQGVASRRYEYLSLAQIHSFTEMRGDLVNNLLVFENYPVSKEIQNAVDKEIGFELTKMEFLEQTNYDLNLYLVPDDGLEIRMTYNALTYEDQYISTMIEHMQRIIKTVVANPEISLEDIDLLSPEEKHQVLYEFNQTEANWPNDKTLHQLFEEQVERTPDNIAVIFGDQQLTYREFNERANRVAHVLREHGVKPDSPVVIMTERSMEMVVGILGIIKASGTYVPIDPDFPEDRIQYMLSDCGTEILLTDRIERVVTTDKELKIIDLTAEYLLTADSSNLENWNSPADLAYIIYTSGTTGKPKGTMLEHRHVVRLMINDRLQFDFNSKDVWTLFHSMCFDLSVWEMYGAFLYGGKVVIVPKLVAQDAEQFVKLLATEKVTILTQTPSAFYNLIDIEMQSPQKQLKLRYIVFAGEALKPVLLKGWKAKYPETHLINMYGITEITVHATFKEVTEDEIETNSGNIGVPIPTLTTYIMDSRLNLLPIGVAGEICVGGIGVARGYLNKPELTAKKFVMNPHKPGERIYRSGDLARLLPNGEMEYIGRIDHQVKIRGYRVELGEIESHLLRHELIKEVVVTAREDVSGGKYLCAYMVTEGDVTVEELRKYLAKDVPDYMIPAFFVRLDQMPLTANGKVDRRALPEPDDSVSTGVEYVPPRNEIETTLAEVWREVLGCKQVGIKDNFFSLGGDSIKAIQVASRLNKYGLKMEIKDLFQNPILGELSGLLKSVDLTVEQGIVEGEVPLTPIQRWFFEQNFTNLHHFNHSVMLYNKEGFDQDIIAQVFTKIVEHHDALRMSFKIEDGKIKQFNRGIDGKLFDLEVVNLQDESAAFAKIEEVANRIQAGMDLENGPLVRLGLFKTSEGDHLLVVIHHLVVDGVSWRIIFEDLTEAYQIAQTGKEIELPAKSHSFKVWSEKQEVFAQSKELKKQLEYWEMLAQKKVAPLPKDHSIASRKVKNSTMLSAVLNEEYTTKLLKEANTAYNTEINDLLLVALGLTFKKWSGKDNLVLNLEGHGREDIISGVDIVRTIGWFTSLYPILLDMSNSDDLSYLIKVVKEDLRKIPNKGIGYGIMRYLTNDERTDILTLQPEICFNYLGQFDQEVTSDVFKVSNAPTGRNISLEMEKIYAFDINGIIADGQLVVNFTYDAEEYKKETVQSLVDGYTYYLQQIIDHCVVQEETDITPADLGDSSLSLEELDLISGIFDED